MNCLDPSDALDLGRLLGQDPEEALAHLVECQACRRAVRSGAALSAVLGQDGVPRHGFVQEVQSRLREPSPAPTSPANAEPGWAGRFVVWGLASATAVAAAAAAGTAAPVQPGAAVLLVSALWALVAGSVTGRRSSASAG